MIEYFNGQGINTYNNPLQYDGQLIHGLNITGFPMGGYSKRGGYGTFLNNPDSNQVNALIAFPHQNGTQIELYRASGSLLYYSLQGTANWQVAQGSAGTADAGGTILNGNFVDSAILNNVLIVADGGTVRHTTNGTQFLNTSLAPAGGQYLSQYHNRIYVSDGTSSTLTFSSYGSADNWSIATPADSSSFTVPGEGAITKHFSAGDRLNIPKNKGRMYSWDDNSLVDMATTYGPTNPKSIQQIDDYYFWMNQVGIFGFDGANKQLLSNPIQRQFVNRLGAGISGNNFGNAGLAVGAAYIWDYLIAVGGLTDDFTGRRINDALIKYDYQKNQFMNWQFSDFPTAMLSFKNYLNSNQLLFGNAQGQVFLYDITRGDDNGQPIATDMVFLFTYAEQANKFNPTSAQTIFGSSFEKKWDWIRLFFSPGCELNIQFSFSNSLSPAHQIWSEAVNIKANTKADYWQESDGVVEIRFPTNNENNKPRSRFMFLRIYDNSASSMWSYYGCQISAEIMDIE